MPSIADLLVRIGADVSQLQAAFAQSEAGMQRLVREMGGIEQASMKLAGGLAAVGTGLLALTALNVRAASEAQREVQLLEQALRLAGEAADVRPYQKLAEQMQKLTGVSDEQILSMARLLFSYKATGEQVQQLIPRILDYAAATGRDANEATLAFARALTGQDAALQRVLGRMGEGISLSTNFAGAIRELDARFGGQAATLGQQLGPQLSRLRQALNDLQELMGAPMLQPLTLLVSGLARLAEALRDFAAAHPLAAQAMATFIGVMGVAALGAGGVLAFRLLMTKLIGTVLVYKGVMVDAATRTTTFSAQLVLAKGAMHALNVALRANLLGVLITGIILAIMHWKQFVAALQAGVEFLRSGFIPIMKAVGLIMMGIALGPAGFPLLREGLKQLSKAFQEAGAAAKGSYRQALEDLKPPQDDIEQGVRKTAETLETLQQRYEATAAAAKLFATQQEAAATASAIQALAQPGLDEEQLRAIEERRQRLISEGAQQELQTRIMALRIQLQKALEVASEESDAVKKIRQALADAERDLLNRRYDDHKAVAGRIVAAEKAAAEERIRIEQHVRDEQARAVSAVLSLRQQEAQHAAAMARLQEETRVGMLRRMVSIQQTLGGAILGAQENLIRIQTAREEQALAARNARRAQLVREGFLAEAEAAAQAAEERLRLQTRAVEREAALEQQRLAIAQQISQAEAALAVVASQAQLQAIDAEAAARKAQVETNMQLRLADLANAEAKARTEAEIAIRGLQAEAEARAAMGQLTPEELAAIRQRQQAIIDGFTATQERMKTEAAAMARTTAMALEAVDKETAARRLDVQQELQVELTRLANGDVQARAQAAARIQSLETQLASEIQTERERLAQAGLTEAEIEARTRGAQGILASVARASEEQVGKVETALAAMQSVYQRFADAVGKALQPVVDILELLGDPKRLADLAAKIKDLPQIALPAAAAPAAVGAGAAAAAGMIVNVSGTQVTLAADEQRLFQRLLRMMMGPEGAKVFDDFVRRQAGMRR